MVFSSRLCGIARGVAVFTRLLLPPTLITIVLAIIYTRFAMPVSISVAFVLRRKVAA